MTPRPRRGLYADSDDGDARSALRVVGDRCIAGVSCYDDLDLAVAAARDGAMHVAFGSFCASPTKPRAVPAPVRLRADPRGRRDVPIAAFGGIAARNGAALIEAGPDVLAAIHGVFGTKDVEHAAHDCAAPFS